MRTTLPVFCPDLGKASLTALECPICHLLTSDVVLLSESDLQMVAARTQCWLSWTGTGKPPTLWYLLPIHCSHKESKQRYLVSPSARLNGYHSDTRKENYLADTFWTPDRQFLGDTCLVSHYSLPWVLTNASFDVLKLRENIHLIVQSEQLAVE